MIFFSDQPSRVAPSPLKDSPPPPIIRETSFPSVSVDPSRGNADHSFSIRSPVSSVFMKFRFFPLFAVAIFALAAPSAITPAHADDAPADAAKPPLRDVLKATPFKIAYEAYVDGQSDIYVMNADGSDVQRITHTEGGCAHYPQISPDGTKICYNVDSGEGTDTIRSLWVVDVDGKNPKKIADRAREPFWKPDGKVIGYLPQEFQKFSVIDFATKGMMFYHLETGETEPHQNADNFRHLYHPRFSPNGKWIVATVHGGMGFGHGILALEAHGNKIINTGLPGCRPTISPDGQHIAWGSSDHELTTAAFDTTSDDPKPGARELHIKDAKNKIYHIAWSPDSEVRLVQSWARWRGRFEQDRNLSGSVRNHRRLCHELESLRGPCRSAADDRSRYRRRE